MHVTVIAKTPVAGAVKTRLSPPCSPEQAALIARAAFTDSLHAAGGVAERTGARRILLLEGDRQPWMDASFDVVPQRGAGLEQRLSNGFVDLGPGVIVGMETPHVAFALEDALRWARRGVDSLGLATDGGYWMIGLCAASVARVDDLFERIPMSRSHTGIAQLRRLHAHGRPVRMLPMARDLDTIQDLRAVAGNRHDGLLAKVAADVLAVLP